MLQKHVDKDSVGDSVESLTEVKTDYKYPLLFPCLSSQTFNQRRSLPVLPGMELIFFIVTHMVLYFGFVTRTGHNKAGTIMKGLCLMDKTTPEQVHHRQVHIPAGTPQRDCRL